MCVCVNTNRVFALSKVCKEDTSNDMYRGEERQREKEKGGQRSRSDKCVKEFFLLVLRTSTTQRVLKKKKKRNLKQTEIFLVTLSPGLKKCFPSLHSSFHPTCLTGNGSWHDKYTRGHTLYSQSSATQEGEADKPEVASLAQALNTSFLLCINPLDL